MPRIYVPGPSLRDRLGWLPGAILAQIGGVVALGCFLGAIAAYVALAEAMLRGALR